MSKPFRVKVSNRAEIVAFCQCCSLLVLLAVYLLAFAKPVLAVLDTLPHDWMTYASAAIVMLPALLIIAAFIAVERELRFARRH